MAIDFFKFGEVFPDSDISRLQTDQTRSVYLACEQSAFFTVISIGHVESEDSEPIDVIIVECFNDQVPTRNTVGINVRERLALCFSQSSSRTPEIRALRKCFPYVPHLNHVPSNEPTALCIYFEAWHVIERTWTAEKFLQRILWWLTETAKDSLHREDQPVERVYFDAPFEIVLPPDFNNNIKNENFLFCLEGIQHSTKEPFKVAKGLFFEAKKEITNCKINSLCPITIDCGTIVHGVRERYPTTLGELNEQLTYRDVNFTDALKKSMSSRVGEKGVVAPLGKALIIMYLSLIREVGAEVEDIETRAFWVDREFIDLGTDFDLLIKKPDESNDKYYFNHFSNQGIEVEAESWKDIPIVPIDISYAVTREFTRRASGIDNEDADFSGLIGGAGALGATLVEIWSKESWGDWTIVDDDILRSHNVIRHIGNEYCVGYRKADIVAKIAAANFWPNYTNLNPICDHIESQENESVREALLSADLLVDATTTLYAPRDLAVRDSTPRTASIFLTPSGRDSVLFIEDNIREVRVDQLEPQYYKALIDNEWGREHLKGHLGNILVGAGCRDISVIMSFEDILLHSANLSKQVRLLRKKDTPAIRVWSYKQKYGEMQCFNVPVFNSIIAHCNNWRIVCSIGLQDKLKTIRHSAIPKETGGIIVGYLDQKLRSIYVVDVLNAPADSESSPAGFTRGIEGLKESLDEISKRTANIVQYIGEWHSHPPFSSPHPSCLDNALLESLANSLSEDGLPALMIIVGANGELSLSVETS